MTSQLDKIANEFAAYQLKRQAEQKRHEEEPLPGIKDFWWRAPAEWGKPVRVEPVVFNNRPMMLLYFSNGERVLRLAEPKHGWRKR